jgi:GAF domain-containing protein
MLADEPTGQPMKRRSTVSGKPAQLRGPKASKSKRVSRPREASRPTSSAVDNEGEVARLTRQLDEAREQQTATSEVLRIISSSPGELQPVFDAILNNAVRICAAQNATLWLFGDGRFRSVARFADIPDVGLDQTQPGPKSGLGRLRATKQIVHIEDYATEPAYRERDPFAVRAVERVGVRTNLSVPMLKENELVGAISIFHDGKPVHR